MWERLRVTVAAQLPSPYKIAPVPTPHESLENALRDLPRAGTLVKDRGYRQVWRFEHAGKAYFLKFYPKGGVRDRWRRRFRGSPAMREFLRLQWLQKAGVSAPRAVSVLLGFRLNERRGDAVILEAIEPGVQLDLHLNELALRGERSPNHRDLAQQVRTLMLKLGQAGLGHGDLHLGNFLLSDGKLYLLDAYAVRRGGLRTNDLLQLAHSVSRFATRTDLLRGWFELGGGSRMPRDNPVARRRFAAFMQKVTGSNRYFGMLSDGAWRGSFFKRAKYARRWSSVSQSDLSEADWRSAWKTLREKIEADSFEVLKRSPSGDVLAGELTLGGKTIPVIVKHPRRKYWYRWLNEIGRGSRPRRAWMKSWELVARDIPVAWPMLLMEKRVAGYVTDAIIVFERVPGKTLFHAELDAILPGDRDMLFRRAGRALRAIDAHGFSHLDAKSTNFIVREDEKLGPTPVLIDMDGIKRTNWRVGAGIERLLRAMQRHAQYTVADSLALCQGYAPFSKMHQEKQPT
jgi:tRNA A-37 threonylcarbamoyl transferase component Bud32